MVESIKYGGMTLVQSDNGVNDGLLCASHNLIYEDGAIRPVIPGKVYKDGINAHKLFLHKQDYTHYLVIEKERRFDIYVYNLYLYLDEFKSKTFIMMLDEAPVDMNSVGNTVMISMSNNIYYLRWDGDKYVVLGTEIPNVDITWALSGDLYYKSYKSTRISFSDDGGDGSNDMYKAIATASNEDGSSIKEITLAVTLKKDTMYAFFTSSNCVLEIHGKDSKGNENADIIRRHFHAGGVVRRVYFKCLDTYTNVKVKLYDRTRFTLEEGQEITVARVVENKEDNYTKVMSIMNSYVNNYATKRNKFIYPFFVRYAVRMYDGTYMHISSPILMLPNTGYVPIVTYGEDTHEDEIHAYGVVADLQYNIAKSLDENWRDIIAGVDVFVSQQIFPYSQGQEYDASKEDLFTYRVYNKSGSDTLTGSTSSISNLHFGGLSITKDCYVKTDLCKVLQDNTGFGTTGNEVRVVQVSPVKNLTEKIYNTGTFFFLKTLTFEELVSTDDLLSSKVGSDGQQKITIDSGMTGTGGSTGSSSTATAYKKNFINLDIPDGVLVNLVTRRQMEDNITSNRIFKSGKLFSYNNRIHVYDATLRLAAPMLPNMQNGYMTPYERLTELRSLKAVYVYTHTNDGDRIVKVPATTAMEMDKNLLGSAGLNWFFYPDNRAYKAVFEFNKVFYDDQPVGSGEIKVPTISGTITINLKQHDILNGAYWISDDFADLMLDETRFERMESDIAENEYVYRPFTVFVSEANNPFVFYQENTVDIGCTKIYALSSAAKAMSTGQFGQYPLYAFTDNGIWAMTLAENGVYEARQPICRDVCIYYPSVTQIDTGVVFASDKGVMLLYGSDVMCVSTDVSGKDIHLEDYPRLENLLDVCSVNKEFVVDHIAFVQFLQGANISYDYSNSRIIMYNEQCDYAYVYSFKSKCWSTMSCNMTKSVNSYPEAWCIGYNGEIINLSQYQYSGLQSGFVATRPIKLTGDSFKTITELVQHGRFIKGNVSVALYGSNDLYHWHIVSTSKTHRILGYSGTPYKYYSIVAMCHLGYEEYLDEVSMNYSVRLNNKLR